MKPITKYSSNNSGGDWWLTDKDWHKLEKAGWKVDWVKNQNRTVFKTTDGRWLGALATEATRELPLEQAISEWEKITGQRADAPGCSCCGQPHSFCCTTGDEVEFGPYADYGTPNDD